MLNGGLNNDTRSIPACRGIRLVRKVTQAQNVTMTTLLDLSVMQDEICKKSQQNVKLKFQVDVRILAQID